MHLTYI